MCSVSGVVKSLQFPGTSLASSYNSLLSLLPTSRQHSSLDPLSKIITMPMCMNHYYIMQVQMVQSFNLHFLIYP